MNFNLFFKINFEKKIKNKFNNLLEMKFMKKCIKIIISIVKNLFNIEVILNNLKTI